MLRRKLVQLRIFERFHLMWQVWRDINAVTGKNLEFLKTVTLQIFLDLEFQAPLRK
jgi:hypothetical protein